MAGPVAPPFSPAVANTFTALQTFSAGANLALASAPATNAVGFLGLPQSIKSANYQAALADSGSELYFGSSSGHTGTIPANSSVAFPIGTILIWTILSGTLTVAITTDTLTLVPAGTTGSRTVTGPGFLIVRKVAATSWLGFGLGVT